MTRTRSLAALRCPGELAMALVLVMAALGVALVQQATGVRLVTPGFAADGKFAVVALHYFRDAVAQGVWWPRWITMGNGGLGSPIFFYYPPGAYAVATFATAPWPGMSDAAAVGLGCTIFRIASVLSCAAWLRHRTDTPTALLGGALYGLMPYVAYVNPQLRLAFAETAAGAILPLVFLAVDLGAARIGLTIFCLAPAMAGLALTHLPMSVLSGGLAVAYGAFSAGSLLVAARRALAAAAGVAVGLGLAGTFLVPAMLLQSSAQLAMLATPNYLAEHNFLFAFGWRSANPRWEAALDAFVAVPVLAAVLGWYVTRRPAVPGRRALLLTLALALFLATPLSGLAWTYLPLLRRIQFPYRLALPISLLGAACLALALPLLSRRARYGIGAGCLAYAVVLAGVAWQRGDHGRSNAVRTEEALASGGADPPEFIPAAAAAYDWHAPREQGAAALRAAMDALSGCAAHRGLPALRAAGRVTVALLGCDGPVLLPQFDFPGWAGPVALPPPVADPATGLVLLTVPPGTEEVVLQRVPTGPEVLGGRVTLVAGALWLAAGLAARLTTGRTTCRPPLPRR